jgi:hypothetical protein
MKRSASRAAASTPAALYKAAKRLEWRSDGIACKASSSAAKATRAPATTSGRPSEAEHQCEDEIANEVVDLPVSPERGSISRGPGRYASRTKAAPLQTFSMSLIVILLGSLLVPPHIGAKALQLDPLALARNDRW